MHTRLMTILSYSRRPPFVLPVQHRYPDVIESCPPPGSGQKHSHTIKSHHNVGGLPKDLQFTLIEPFRELFKVRDGGCCTARIKLPKPSLRLRYPSIQQGTRVYISPRLPVSALGLKVHHIWFS